ncbi:hypothetical protein SASPL_118013 [Salvia splendens]|uniref:Proteasome subunit beta n=1 Tax=Salvia splendens TaxID=180675 RepID=A0A8X8Y0J4_SALSN|nr:hypothetical protein SASPL_118013 [Salvia splendens]
MKAQKHTKLCYALCLLLYLKAHPKKPTDFLRKGKTKFRTIKRNHLIYRKKLFLESHQRFRNRYINYNDEFGRFSSSYEQIARFASRFSKNSYPRYDNMYPYVTGTSVIGIKYKDGLLFAADMGGSYGSTLRYKSVERLKSVGKHSVIGASGEISDFQEIMRYLDELILFDNMWDDGNSLGPKEVHNYLTRVMYNRRNKFNPLWNSLVLGGIKNGKKYLGTVSMIGVHYEDDHVATGFGNHLARPILRDEWHENLTYEEGVKLLEKCMRVLLYRDRSAVNKLQIAKITEEGFTVSEPYSLKTFWDFNAFKNPTLGAEGSW